MGGARARDDGALVDVEGVGFDGDVRVAFGQESGEPPVGGGPPPVEQPGGGERERPDAVGGDERPARVGGGQRVEHGGPRGRAELGPGQGDHEVGGGQPVQTVLDDQGQPDIGADVSRPVGAEGEVEEGKPAAAGVEHLGDDARAEHADPVRGVGGDGDERRHGASLARGPQRGTDDGGADARAGRRNDAGGGIPWRRNDDGTIPAIGGSTATREDPCRAEDLGT